jgi:hypothetical protein
MIELIVNSRIRKDLMMKGKKKIIRKEIFRILKINYNLIENMIIDIITNKIKIKILKEN